MKGKIYNTDNAEIIINGNKIKQVKFTTFLGIHIDEHLSWTIHINNLSQTIARNVGMLNQFLKMSTIVYHEDFILFINIISYGILCPIMVEHIQKSI